MLANLKFRDRFSLNLLSCYKIDNSPPINAGDPPTYTIDKTIFYSILLLLWGEISCSLSLIF